MAAMSSGAEIAVVLPLMIVEAVGRAVFAAADAALERAEQEYQARVRQDLARQGAAHQAEESAAVQQAAEAAMVQATRMQAAQDANRAFLRAGVERLVASAPDDPSPGGARARARALAEALADPAQPLPALLAHYTALAEELRARPAPVRPETPAVDTGAVDLLEELLASPLLTERERATWRGRVAELRALAAREPALAEQGLAQLSRQVERALQEAAERAQARAEAAAAVREQVGIALPRLQVVARRAPLDDHRARARALLAQAAELVAREPAEALPPLRGLAGQAQALYDAFRAAVAAAAQRDALSAQVSDVLLSLGYRVAQLPGEEDLIAPLNQRVGVVFAADADGKLVAEMVALAPEAARLDPGEQERVCALVDEVVAGLRARACTVRERTRKRRDDTRRRCVSSRRLRVVDLPPAAAPSSAAAAPKHQEREA